MQTSTITMLLLTAAGHAAAAQVVTKTTVRSADAYAIGNADAGASLSASSTVTRSTATIYGNGTVITAKRWDHVANRSAYASLFGRTAEAAGISGHTYAANGTWTESLDFRTRQWTASNFVFGPQAGYSLTLRVAGLAERTISAQVSSPLQFAHRISRTLFTSPRVPFDVPLGIVLVDGTVTAEGGFSGALATNFSSSAQPLVTLAADGYVAGTFSAIADFIVSAIDVEGALHVGDIGVRFTVCNDTALGSVLSRIEYHIAPLSAWAQVRFRILWEWTRFGRLFSWSAGSYWALHTLR